MSYDTELSAVSRKPQTIVVMNLDYCEKTYGKITEFLEDFTTYTEVDPNGHITVYANRVEWTGLVRGEKAYVYKDKGVNHFDGDFEHLLEIEIAASDDQGISSPWVLANTVEAMFDLRGGSIFEMQVFQSSGTPDIYLSEWDSGTQHVSSSYGISFNTRYYLKIKRDESVGAFGTIYCYIYSDSARTNLLQTLSVALHTSKKDFRYVYACTSYGSVFGEFPQEGATYNLDLREYGCTASGAAGSECNNTRVTCQDSVNYVNTTGKDYKFCKKGAPVPISGEEIRPYLIKESYIPTRINPSKSLTENARITLEFADEPDNDIGIDPYVGNRSSVQGTFWKKFFARNPYYTGRTVTIKKGFQGLAEANYASRKFIIDQVDGPNNGVVKIICKDLLKLADKVEVPRATSGKLTGAIGAGTTNIGCDLISDYPTNGVVRIGDELIKYSTVNSTAFLLGSTGARGHNVGRIITNSTSHSENTKIQLCYTTTDINVWDIMEDVLVNEVGISTADIDQTGAEAERDQWLLAFNFTGVISKPMKASKVLEELQEQSLSNLWWSDEEQVVRFKVFAPPSPGTTVAELNDTANIMSIKTDNNEISRVSRVVVNFGKKRLDDDDDPEAYEFGLVLKSTDSEAADQYNQQAIKTINSRWTTSESIAGAVGNRLKNRFRDPAKRCDIMLELKDSTIITADIVNITSTGVVGTDGFALDSRPFQVTAKKQESEGSFKYEIVDTGMSNRVGFIAPDGFPDYSSATDAQKKYCFISDTAFQMSNGDPSYYIF